MFIMRILISADYEKNEKKKGNDKNDEKAKSRSSISDDVINILCLGTRFSDNFQDNKFFFKARKICLDRKLIVIF